eukprot:117635-Rhodomonas_salina.2
MPQSGRSSHEKPGLQLCKQVAASCCNILHMSRTKTRAKQTYRDGCGKENCGRITKVGRIRQRCRYDVSRRMANGRRLSSCNGAENGGGACRGQRGEEGGLQKEIQVEGIPTYIL